MWSTYFLYSVYSLCGLGLLVYGLNTYFYLQRFLFHRSKTPESPLLGTAEDWPVVLTQLPVYNEANVIERLLQSVTAMDYPRERHFIQVLDDSTDGSEKLSKEWVEIFKNEGYRIEWVHRVNRAGYKAGALKEGLARSFGENAEFIAMFDADFLPTKDFLKRALGALILQDSWAFVQGRWGHLNGEKSLLTLAQSVGIDGHFAVEQVVRSQNSLFMNFNGSGGIWRRQAILDGGNWEADTLTEDLDLSYRVQLKGWQCGYLNDLEVPAEIPEEINAFKQQQYRWAKGSFQTALKMLPKVWASDKSLVAKWFAFIHLTHYGLHPLMLASAVLSVPVLFLPPPPAFHTWFGLFLIPVLLSTMAPSLLYLVAQKSLYPERWKKRLLVLPLLASFGVGLAVNNSRAVCSALCARSSGFVRTPKKGDQLKAIYRSKFPKEAILEGGLGIFCFFAPLILWMREGSLTGGQKMVIPFLLLYSSGFLTVSVLSLWHWWGQERTIKSQIPSAIVERTHPT